MPVAAAASSLTLWLLSELPALAETTDFSKGGFAKESYYVTLGLFLISLPGMPPSFSARPASNYGLYGCLLLATTVKELMMRAIVSQGSGRR